MQNAIEAVPGERSHNDMDMIWHHAPLVQFVTPVVEMSQRLHHNRGHRRLAKRAGACAGIQKCIEFFRMQLQKPLVFDG